MLTGHHARRRGGVSGVRPERPAEPGGRSRGGVRHALRARLCSSSSRGTCAPTVSDRLGASRCGLRAARVVNDTVIWIATGGGLQSPTWRAPSSLCGLVDGSRGFCGAGTLLCGPGPSGGGAGAAAASEPSGTPDAPRGGERRRGRTGCSFDGRGSPHRFRDGPFSSRGRSCSDAGAGAPSAPCAGVALSKGRDCGDLGTVCSVRVLVDRLSHLTLSPPRTPISPPLRVAPTPPARPRRGAHQRFRGRGETTRGHFRTRLAVFALANDKSSCGGKDSSADSSSA